MTPPTSWLARSACSTCRIGMPRSDLKVTINGVPVQAGFALASYAAFKQLETGAMVMGDLVSLDEEVNPVMSGLSARRLC